MAFYCIGDIQGCDDAFEQLLQTVDFSASRDTLYVLGDLVNRGPKSAEVLRRCMLAGDSMRALLGNHDLHLLAAAQGLRTFVTGLRPQTSLATGYRCQARHRKTPLGSVSPAISRKSMNRS